MTSHEIICTKDWFSKTFVRFPNAIILAFVLINVAAVFRVLFPILVPNWYNLLFYGSTLAWLGAFSLFIFVYAPILNSPRIDNRED
jgi:uncharacterized protein involved in response to NO